MPGYEDYGRFLVESLKPLIDGKYRTLTGPTNTAVMGSSLGGVVSAPSSSTWPYPKRNTTRMHGLRAVRSRSSSFLEACHGSQNRGDPKQRRRKFIYRPDSKGAYENILSSCLEVRVVR
jgi:hypothetical protein